MLVLRDRQARRVNVEKPAPKGRKVHAAKPGNAGRRAKPGSRDRRIFTASDYPAFIITDPAAVEFFKHFTTPNQ